MAVGDLKLHCICLRVNPAPGLWAPGEAFKVYYNYAMHWITSCFFVYFLLLLPVIFTDFLSSQIKFDPDLIRVAQIRSDWLKSDQIGSNPIRVAQIILEWFKSVRGVQIRLKWFK